MGPQSQRLFSFLAFLIILASVIQPASAQWCGTETLYFTHEKQADIPTYETIRDYPAGSAEDIENVTVNSGLGYVLIDTYIADPGNPGVTSLLSGLRRFRVYSYVSSASGTTILNFTMIKRLTNGNEVVLYSVETSDINDLTVTEQLVSYVTTTNMTLNTTDRYGVRVYGKTTHPANIQLYWVYEGSIHTSHIESGQFVCPDIPDVDMNNTGSVTSDIISIIGVGVFLCFVGLLIIKRRGL